MDLSKIEDALNIIDLYKFNIDFFSQSSESRYKFDFSKYSNLITHDINILSKIELIQMATEITVCNEMIGDNPDESIKDNLSKMLLNCSALKKIKIDTSLSTEEVRIYIRNFFAHAQYKLNDDGTVSLEYGNILIDLSWSEMVEVKNYYFDAFHILSNNKKNRLLDNLYDLIDMKNINQTFKLRNSISKIRKEKKSNSLNEYIDIIQKFYYNRQQKVGINFAPHILLRRYKLDSLGNSVSILSENFIAEILNDKEFVLNNSHNLRNFKNYIIELKEKNTEYLSEEEQKLLFNYVRYYYAFWDKLDFYQKRCYILNFNNNVINNLPIFNDIELYTYYPKYLLDKKNYPHEYKQFYSYENLRTMESISPAFGEVSQILDLTYYCFGFFKEQNNSANILYSDYSLNDFKLDSTYTTSEFIESYESILRDEKNKNNQKIRKINGLINSMKKGLSNKNNSNKELEEKINLFVSDLNTLIERNKKIDTELQNPEHTNQTRFFSHLRNSLTHGYFKLDYSKAFESRNMQNTIVEFKDYDKNNNNEETFCARISLKKLLSICNKFRFKLELLKQHVIEINNEKKL